MTELYWPNDHAFIDFNRDFEAHGEGTYDVPDDAEEQYLERGWLESEDDEEGDTTLEIEATEDDVEGETMNTTATGSGEVTEADEESSSVVQTELEEGDLEDLDYSEMQQLAKQNDIPANQSADDLQDELEQELDLSESSDSGDDGGD